MKKAQEMKELDTLVQSILFLQNTLRDIDPTDPRPAPDDLLRFRILIETLVRRGAKSPNLDGSCMTPVERAAIIRIALALRKKNRAQADLSIEILALAQSLYILKHGYDEFVKVCASKKGIDEFKLTPQERIVLVYIASGINPKEIASRMGLSVKTVEYYRDMIIRKLGLKNNPMGTTVALTHFAIKRSLIGPVDPTRETFAMAH